MGEKDERDGREEGKENGKKKREKKERKCSLRLKMTISAIFKKYYHTHFIELDLKRSIILRFLNGHELCQTIIFNSSPSSKSQIIRLWEGRHVNRCPLS